jgi:hypothetical protein
MAVGSPSERVYYYECSNGRFRLTYFIPPGELRRLCDDKLISPLAERDFPDGVDLGCTEPDFRHFEETYGFHPQQNPDALRRAFFAILSATHNWKKFCGSGFIPAADLERHVEPVDTVLFEKELMQRDVKPKRDQLSLIQRRQLRRNQAVQQTRTYRVLRELQVKGIDPERTLPQQVFSPIKMEEGTSAEEIFVRLHQKQRKEE